MFGFTPFGSIPFGDSSAVLNIEGMLGDESAEFIYTAEITIWPLDGNSALDTEKLYLGTSEWATFPADFPANQPFRGVLRQALSFRRSLLGGAGIGTFTSDAGSIIIDNADGFYDTIVDTYAIDGREVTVRVGRVTDAYADHFLVFKGVATDWAATESTLMITVRDFGYKLDVPAQPNVYAGTGDAEGGEELTGKRRPRCLGGTVQGVQPLLINTSLLIYQLSDDPLTSITPVFDRGVPLSAGSNHANYAALAATTIAAGDFDRCLPEGLIRLGAAPDGIVFGGAIEVISTTSEIVHGLLSSTAGLSANEINKASFDVVDAASNVSVNYFLGHDDALSVADVIARLMSGIGGWGGFRRNGTFELGIFAAPSGSPVQYFAAPDIISLDRERLPSGIWPPPWRWRVAYDRTQTVFTDFAGSVAAAFRARFAQPYFIAISEDTGILEDHSFAQDAPPVEAHFSEESSAQTEADRLLALYGTQRALYRFTTTRKALNRELGEVIHVTFPRFGLDGGRLMTIVEIGVTLPDPNGIDTVEIVAYG